MKNFANVDRWFVNLNHSEFCGMVVCRGRVSYDHDYVLYEDYEELLNAYRTLIDKVSDVVGEAAFGE